MYNAFAFAEKRHGIYTEGSYSYRATNGTFLSPSLHNGVVLSHGGMSVCMGLVIDSRRAQVPALSQQPCHSPLKKTSKTPEGRSATFRVQIFFFFCIFSCFWREIFSRSIF